MSMENNPALDDEAKTKVVAAFLGKMVRELESRELAPDMTTALMAHTVGMCASALTEMKRYPDPLDAGQAKVFVEAYSLGSLYR